jgi:large subunit ribosomal protein L3
MLMSNGKVYTQGLIGTKLGMTQIFTDEGKCIPVTVIKMGPCVVLEVKRKDTHGYEAVKLGFEPKKTQRVDNALKGAFAKIGKGCFKHVGEVRCKVDSFGETELGREILVGDVFNDGELVDVSGTSIGRGFSGVVRRFKVKGQPATRGTHEYRRHIGAIGCRKFPGRVFKNQKMPGRMGNENVTTQNLTVVGLRAEDNVLLIKGGVPGSKGSLVVVRKTTKSYGIQKKAVKAA